MKGFRDEAHYRSVMTETLARIERAFDAVDPDLAECTSQFGALTIAFPGGQKLILSSQPSVSQLWMAIAARGTAYHFDFDHESGEWRDDRGEGIEALALLSKLLQEIAGLRLKF